MKEVYYKILANDDADQSGKIKTLKEARETLADYLDYDRNELGLEDGLMDYYIVKYTETDDEIIEEEIK